MPRFAKQFPFCLLLLSGTINTAVCCFAYPAVADEQVGGRRGSSGRSAKPQPGASQASNPNQATSLTKKTAEATVHHSSKLGWKSGADVSQSFATLLTNGTINPGDELIVEDSYRIAGHLQLPDRFTISAVKGAGFDVADAVKPKIGKKALLQLGDRNTLRNLTIKYLNTPPLGPTGERHEVNFTSRVGVAARGKGNLRIENCRLIGSIGHHISLADCNEPEIIGCHIAGGHWSVMLSGVNKPVLRRCLIEKCQGDAIKTGAYGPKGVRGALVEECVFQDNLRDGIDTTGGWKDAVVRNCIFRRLREGLDIKAFYERAVNVSPDNSCSNILIENCQFYDMPNGITLTTIDGGLRKGPGNELITAVNMKDCAPHDINIVNCIFGYTETPLRPRGKGGYGVDYPSRNKEHMRMLFVKDAYAIQYKDIRFHGDQIMPYKISSIGNTKNLSREAAHAIERTVTGNILAKPAPRVRAGITTVPFAVGPQ